jgi:hypothetical protein
MLNKKNLLLTITFFILFNQNVFSQTKKNETVKKQTEIFLVIDNEIEVLPMEDADKKKHITIALSKANAKLEYIFIIEIDKIINEYKFKCNEGNVFSYNETFKIISSKNSKYKIIDKKKLLN